jgi:maltose alpha-D-glucosyltransferase/alpha-amylase
VGVTDRGDGNVLPGGVGLRDRWYKNGLIYEVSVRTFFDSNEDGVGDLPGLSSQLDYLGSLGVTCLWLLPFYPSPWRDDGYDITDHFQVHPDIGSLGDLVDLVHRAGDRGMRVLLDLVLNHTSDQHPWFRAARGGHPKYRDYYIWADSRPPDAEKGVVFPGVQKTTWSFDRRARRYYFHRFYDFEPDLNISNPDVRAEMEKIIGFWAELGIAGFRVDAVPFLIEPAGAEGPKPQPRFDYLHQFRGHLSWRRADAVLLGEANVERDQAEDYFGIGGMHMLFNFEANRSLWLALAHEDPRPLVKALQETAGIPSSDQWANFLRNHDEIDLGRLTDQDRQDVFAAFGPEPGMRLYERGIRRRLAPMLGADRRRLELALSLLLTLPGTPVLYSGDEIGMGEDLSLPEREPVRTPMQWSAGTNGGFSRARRRDLATPVISTGAFSYRKVNVADQQRDPDSWLNWIRSAVRVRAQCPEFGLGDWEPLATGARGVMALRFRDGEEGVMAVHNLSDEPQTAKLERLERPVEVFGNRRYETGPNSGTFDLDPYGYRWLRTRVHD